MPRLRITKNGRRLLYVGIVAYLVFLVHALPASLLARYILPSLSVSRVIHLQDVSGSIWQGQAADAKVSNFDLGELHWDVHSWGLLLGKLKLGLVFGQGDVQGNADLSAGMGGAVSASDVNLQFPAQNLMPLLYGYPVSISGMLRGNLKQISVERGRELRARGRIVWQDARIRAPQDLAIGDYLITVKPVNSGSKLVIKDQGRGPVQVSMTVFIKGTGQYRLNGWLKARDPNQQSVTEALRMMGRPDNSGRYWLGFKGKLRGW